MQFESVMAASSVVTYTAKRMSDTHLVCVCVWVLCFVGGIESKDYQILNIPHLNPFFSTKLGLVLKYTLGSTC